jgi:hypothetical protein
MMWDGMEWNEVHGGQMSVSHSAGCQEPISISEIVI